MDAVHVGGLGGTYGGNPVAAAASIAVLDMIERDDLLARSRAVGATIMERFDGVRQRYEVVGDVRGRGAMCAIELVADRGTKEPLGAETMNAIARRCLEEGVLVLTAGTYGNVVRLLPPLTIDDALLADGLDVLDDRPGGRRRLTSRLLERLLPFADADRRPDPAATAGDVRVCVASCSISPRSGSPATTGCSGPARSSRRSARSSRGWGCTCRCSPSPGRPRPLVSSACQD